MGEATPIGEAGSIEVPDTTKQRLAKLRKRLKKIDAEVKAMQEEVIN